MYQKRIIDKRNKEKFQIDDEYLNGMARLCGWQATLVYNSICRHADKNQQSFPSIKLMSEQHSVHRDTIIKGIKNLEKRNVIEIKKKRTKSGTWLNNTYILIDKSEWNYNHVSNIPSRCERHGTETSKNEKNVENKEDIRDIKDSQVGVSDTGSHVGVSNIPCRCERHGTETSKNGKNVENKEDIKNSHVGVSDTKEQGNTYKETHSRKATALPSKNPQKEDSPTNKDIGKNIPSADFDSANSDSDSVMEAKMIAEIIKTFELVNPSCKRMYGNITQRKACSFLLKEYGFSGTINTILKLKESNEKNYFPTILTPNQLANKWTNLETAEKREKSQSKTGLKKSEKAPSGKYKNDKKNIVVY